MNYKIEILGQSLDGAIRRARAIVGNDIPVVWIIAPDGRTIAGVEYARPSRVWGAATLEERLQLLVGLPNVVMGGI